MNNVEKLAKLLEPGGKARIAEICEVSTSLVSRWVRRGHISAGYNVRLKRGLADYAAARGKGADWANEAVACLNDDVCPTCGREIN